MSELLEKILDKKNIDRAYQQICLREDTKAEDARYFDENWDKIQDQIRQRSYAPQTPAASMTDRIIQQGLHRSSAQFAKPFFQNTATASSQTKTARWRFANCCGCAGRGISGWWIVACGIFMKTNQRTD